MKQISAQRLIDIKAILFIAAITVIIALFGATFTAIIALRLVITEPYDGNTPAEGILLISVWISTFLFLMPIWIFLAGIIQWLVGWPKGAFARASLTSERSTD